MTRYRLREIGPNPFRNVDRYPIDQAKVDALKASIGRTSFWDNIVARPVGTGAAEIAYGHHRLRALRDLYGPDHEVDLITRDLDDEQMLRIMADENMQEWASSAPVVVETVRAVRDFLRAGASKASTGGRPPENGSTAAIVAFLNWPRGRVEDALTILTAEEAGILTPEDTDDLGIEQAAVMRQNVGRIADPVVRREAITRVRSGLASGAIGKRGIADVVAEVRHEARGDTSRPVVPAAVAARLYRDIDDYWRVALVVGDQAATRGDVLRLIAENRNTVELTASVRPWADQIADALRRMADEATRYADLLGADAAVEAVAR